MQTVTSGTRSSGPKRSPRLSAVALGVGCESRRRLSGGCLCPRPRICRRWRPQSYERRRPGLRGSPRRHALILSINFGPLRPNKEGPELTLRFDLDLAA